MAPRKSDSLSAKQRREAYLQAQQRRRRLYLGLGIAAIVIVVAGVVLSLTGRGGSEQAATTPAAPNRLGSADAPVQIVEFGDFGCPSCRQWHNSGVLPKLQAVYGDRISFTFRHFPVITPQSPKAAEASQCAAEQNAFWPYHDYLYQQATDLGVDSLKTYAANLGLDAAAFNTCLDSGRYTAFVENERQAALQAGAQGTPTFFINDRAVSSNPSQMMAVIDQLLP